MGLAQISQKRESIKKAIQKKKKEKKKNFSFSSIAQMLGPDIKLSVQIFRVYMRVKGSCGLFFAFAQTDLGTKVG